MSEYTDIEQKRMNACDEIRDMFLELKEIIEDEVQFAISEDEFSSAMEDVMIKANEIERKAQEYHYYGA